MDLLTSLIVCLCVLLGSVATGVWSQHLLRASPGGESNSRPAHVYGGPLDPVDQGGQSDLYRYTLDNINTVSTEDYKPQRLTKDPHSTYFLLELTPKTSGSNGGSPLVARGDFCAAPSAALQTQIANIQLTDSDNPYFMDSNCDAGKCGWGSFAMNNKSIYFLLTAVFGQYPADLKREIQLRRMEGCDRSLKLAALGSGAVDFQILSCSVHVATIHSEAYAWPNPSIGAWATGSMIAVDAHGVGDAADFLLTIVRKSKNQVTMDLVQVHAAEVGEATVTTLHTADLEDEYGGNWNFPALGEIAYENGTLCWTAAEQLLCGLVEQGRDTLSLTEHSVLVQPQEAYRAGVCTGDVSPLPYGHVLTGVAIARSSDPLVVYFGCYSAQTKVGGTGLVRVSSIGATQLSAVTNGNTRLLSGSLLATPHFSADCLATSPPPQSEDCSKHVATDSSYQVTDCNCVHIEEAIPLTLSAGCTRVHWTWIVICALSVLMVSQR